MALLSKTSLWGLSLAGMLSTASAQQEPGPAQGPQPAPPQKIEDFYGKWMPLDQVVIVVNGDIITQRKIERKIDERLAGVVNSTPDEFRAVVGQIQEAEVESLLIRQAGEDLGLPPDAVESYVKGTLRDDLDEAGGAFGYQRKLRDDDTTALELREDRTTEIYESSWRRKIAGMGSGQERTAEDRYVRPGHLAQRFLRMERTGRDIKNLGPVGAVAASYEFQILLMTPDGAGSMQEAAQKMEQAHMALTSGQAEWDDLVATLGELGGNGLTGRMDRERIEAFLDPGNGAMLEFSLGSEPDSLSPILQFPEVNPATMEKRLAGFAIYKLLARTPAQMPDYSAPNVQNQLRRFIQDEGDKTRWEDELGELKRTAYIWHPEIEAQRAQRRAAQEQRDLEIQKAREQNAARLQAEEEAALSEEGE